MGVATVGLLYATVRRAMNNRTSTHVDDDGTTTVVPAPNWSAPAAALLAGAVMALTPVAVLMFKFNNPDALLVLLLVAAAYAFTRGLRRPAPWWLVAVGALIDSAFSRRCCASTADRPGLRHHLLDRGAEPNSHALPAAACCGDRADRVCRMVDRHPVGTPCQPTCAHTSADRKQIRSWNWCWDTTASAD